MSTPIEINVYRNDQQAYSGTFEGELELGRQQNGEEGPFSRRHSVGGERLVIAPINELGVSRSHLLLSPLDDGTVCVTNLSTNSPVTLKGQGKGGTIVLLAVGEDHKLRPPLTLQIGNVSVVLGRPKDDDSELHSLSHSSKAPGQAVALGPQLLGWALERRPVPIAQEGSAAGSSSGSRSGKIEPFVAWLRVALEILQDAASSLDFLRKTAEATTSLVKLDSAGILLRNGQKWDVVALATTPNCNAREWRPSRNLLSKIWQERKTFWTDPQSGAARPESLEGVAAVVAAPILDPTGNVIGVLYGDRRRYDGASLGELEAMLLELLAFGIGVGLARKEQEEARIRLQQFFPSNLVKQIETNSDLLNGRNALVTVMVCDIVGFSTLAERLGPSETVQWIRAVMSLLSDCVIEHEGVLVDYVGDELMAMWGAPLTQPDDAQRACRALLQMRRLLSGLSERWKPVLGQPTVIGIGLNIGPAFVGNVGSHRKFKYGPLGNTVNIASRVQGASKYLRSFSLITGEVQSRLDSTFPTRRLCRVRLKNIVEPVTIFELGEDPSPLWHQLKDTYEEALGYFESGDFHRATKLLGTALEQAPTDGPSMVLLGRAVDGMRHQGGDFDPVWRLAEK